MYRHTIIATPDYLKETHEITCDHCLATAVTTEWSPGQPVLPYGWTRFQQRGNLYGHHCPVCSDQRAAIMAGAKSLPRRQTNEKGEAYLSRLYDSLAEGEIANGYRRHGLALEHVGDAGEFLFNF